MGNMCIADKNDTDIGNDNLGVYNFKKQVK